MCEHTLDLVIPPVQTQPIPPTHAHVHAHVHVCVSACSWFRVGHLLRVSVSLPSTVLRKWHTASQRSVLLGLLLLYRPVCLDSIPPLRTQCKEDNTRTRHIPPIANHRRPYHPTKGSTTAVSKAPPSHTTGSTMCWLP